MNAVTFLSDGLLATAAGKVVALWDVNACSMKQQLNHEGAVRATSTSTSTVRRARLPSAALG